MHSFYFGGIVDENEEIMDYGYCFTGGMVSFGFYCR